jgi:hypothetical protein
LEDLAAGDAHPVVVGADVDQIRRMDIYGDRTGSQLGGVGTRERLLPRLGVGQEDLHDVGPTDGGLFERVTARGMGADSHGE